MPDLNTLRLPEWGRHEISHVKENLCKNKNFERLFLKNIDVCILFSKHVISYLRKGSRQLELQKRH